MEGIPEGIAVIPFVCNILPISWLYDAEIHVNELDEDFFNSIDQFKQGYISMYPSKKFLGKITADRLYRKPVLKKLKQNSSPLVFFSGGVDATFTLYSKLRERPSLLTIWGSDIYFKNEEEWRTVNECNHNVAQRLNTPYSSVKSSFRFFINYASLNKKINGGNWWHQYQHGIGIISHAAPLVWKHNYKTVYISSTYSPQDGKVTCASAPEIDNHIKFYGCKVVHFDFNVTRQEKIKFICEKSIKENLHTNLRVCWQQAKGYNCCECEKCLRTMLGIIAEKCDPNDFGFELTESKKQVLLEKILDKKIKPTIYYKPIMEKIIQIPEVKDEAYIKELMKSIN